jgi:hypothetical protein
MTEQMQVRYPDHGNPLQKAPNSLEPQNPSNAPSAPPLPPYPATSHTRHSPTGLYSLWLTPGGDKTHVPFRVSRLKEIKNDLGITQKTQTSASRHLENSAKTLNCAGKM